jgi:predicted enzyme related to lactoylglutathione lyase
MSGHITHYEIVAADVDRAKRFWEGVFGWSFGDSVMPDGDYRMARIDDKSGAALSSYGEPGHPNVYLDVDDIEASLAKVRELGGNGADKQPVPGMGWFAACTDSEGNAFSLWQTDAGAA